MSNNVHKHNPNWKTIPTFAGRAGYRRQLSNKVNYLCGGRRAAAFTRCGSSGMYVTYCASALYLAPSLSNKILVWATSSGVGNPVLGVPLANICLSSW